MTLFELQTLLSQPGIVGFLANGEYKIVDAVVVKLYPNKEFLLVVDRNLYPYPPDAEVERDGSRIKISGGKPPMQKLNCVRWFL